MFSWLVLFVAGLFEVAWAYGLKASDGFTKPVVSLLTVAAMGMSFWLLSLALREIPLGTAYAVWVGIGAMGTTLMGMGLLGEPVEPARLGFLLLLGVAIAGLKMTGAQG